MMTYSQQGMQMEPYEFMGLPLFWWVSILIFALGVLVAGHLYRKRK